MNIGKLTAIIVTGALLTFGGAVFAAKEGDEHLPGAGSRLAGESAVMKLGTVAEDHIIAQERTFWLAPKTQVYDQNGRKMPISSLKERSLVRIDYYWGEKRKLLVDRITVVTPPE